jgi:hypothetical protein
MYVLNGRIEKILTSRSSKLLLEMDSRPCPTILQNFAYKITITVVCYRTLLNLLGFIHRYEICIYNFESLISMKEYQIGWVSFPHLLNMVTSLRLNGSKHDIFLAKFLLKSSQHGQIKEQVQKCKKF